ncbi:MAG: T9SS type A sorting domain-containing protein, partial [Bacteroidales bacterium]
LSESLGLNIKGNKVDEGTYQFILNATDKYNAKTSYTLTYTILPNTPPNSIKSIDNIIFNGTSGQETLNLDEYFTDADGESLTYTSSETNSSIAHANSVKNKLYITALEYGENTITVTASDAKGDTASLTFKILVRNGSKLVDLYPNPVKTDLNIRPGEEMENTSITIRSISGNIALEVNNYNIGPFNPTSLDLSGLAAGVYSVTVSEDSGIEYTENIIKL